MASKQVVVITHTYCLDGFAAAWVSYQRYKYRASYHGIHPNSGISELPKFIGSNNKSHGSSKLSNITNSIYQNN